MTKKEEREARKLEKLRLEKERMYEMFSFEIVTIRQFAELMRLEEDHLQVRLSQQQ